MTFWKNKSGRVKEASKWNRPGARFDKAKGDRTVEFIETACRHVKGEMAGQPLLLEWWFKQIVRAMFGWIRPDGTRLYREVYIEVPRKNAKSTYGAALANYLLFADGEMGAEIYSAAADTDQANIVFSIAKGMVEQDRDLAAASESFRRSIVYKSNAYHVLSADAPTKHGKNSHGILFDELHAQPDRYLYDVLKTSTGSRRQPLMIMFTTAGFDKLSICWEVHDYAQKVIDGTVDNPAFLPIIYAADESDDWTSEKTWQKANPNYDVSIKADYLRAECEKAKVTPAYENTFKRLHLNLWTEQETRWLQMTEWDACNAPIDLDKLKGRVCFAGLDLASTTDIAALVLIFPPLNPPEFPLERVIAAVSAAQAGEPFLLPEPPTCDPYIIVPYFWVPKDSIADHGRRDGAPYELWVKQGFLEATPGNTIDYTWIMNQLGKCKVEFDLKAIAFDRWGAQKIVNDLCANYGFTVDPKEFQTGRAPLLIQFGQGFASMSSPTKELLNLILGRKIIHGGHPVLKWMAGNVIVKTDSAANLKPDKSKSTNKIDGIVGAIMGLDIAIRFADVTGASVYESRGVRIL